MREREEGEREYLSPPPPFLISDLTKWVQGKDKKEGREGMFGFK